jgi:hypothetical protein
MQSKRYQIFVSSTYSDLIEERREVIEAIIDLGHIPAGMEGFPAIDIEQFKYIKKVIDQCDYYVLIVAGRYGSLANEGTSFTEREYRYAVESGKVVIAFVIDPAVLTSLLPENLDTDAEIVEKLSKFKADVMTNRLVRLWKDRNALSRAVTKSLLAAFDEFPREGWVRASVQANEDVLAQINELRLRNEALEHEQARLLAQLKPRFDNIASLDETYLLKYKYTDRFGLQNSSVSISWREIFLGAAPKLSVTQTPVELISKFQSYLTASGRVRGRLPSTNSVCANQIVIQLVALGLIKRFTGRSTKGTMGEWVQITEVGSRLMMEELVVKSAQEEVETPGRSEDNE